jgi:hypothetical protein
MTSAVCVLNDGNSNVATLGEYYGQVVRLPHDVRSAYCLPLSYRDAPAVNNCMEIKMPCGGRSLSLELSS